MARPTKLTPTNKGLLLRGARAGLDVSKLMRLVKADRTTFYKWLENPEFEAFFDSFYYEQAMSVMEVLEGLRTDKPEKWLEQMPDYEPVETATEEVVLEIELASG